MKNFYKNLARLLITLQVLYNLAGPVPTFAQEESPSPEVTPPEITTMPQETPPIPTPSLVPTPSSIETGDSLSVSGSETTSNEIGISLTPTPTPEPIHEPDPTITPENEAQTENPPTETFTPTPTPQQPSGISIVQTSETTTQTLSESDSGNNSQVKGNDSEIKTGGAKSISNSITVANLTEINSNVITTIENILTSESEDINLYQELLKAISNNPNFIPLENIYITQEAAVKSDTTATSNSGVNDQESESATTITGDAVAISNSFTSANLNLIGSNMVIALINILADYDGDIILPDYFQSTDLTSNGSNMVNALVNQHAFTDSLTTSHSSTGQNTQSVSRDSNIATGESLSMSNSVSLSNIVNVGGGFQHLIINNFGGWSGDLVNWYAPGDLTKIDNGNFWLSKSDNSLKPYTSEAETQIAINQKASVWSSVESSANTGGNSQISNSGEIKTGDAWAISSNTVLANVTGIGSNMFLGIINILGKWTGNIITPYPELVVSLTDSKDHTETGRPLNYLLSITNSGRAQANGVKLKFNWPAGVIPDSGLQSSWELGRMEPGETKIFNLTSVVREGYEGQTLVAFAEASTTDTQSSNAQNTASDQTIVDSTTTSTYVENLDNRLPQLMVTSWNNTGEFVYPGDSILVKFNIKNTSDFPAKEVVLRGGIITQGENENLTMTWNLGTLRPNGGATISFTVDLDNATTPAHYQAIAKGYATSDSGESVSSQLAVSDFLVKSPQLFIKSVEKIVPEAVSQIPEAPPTVLGSSTQAQKTDLLRIPPYVLPILALLYVGILLARRKLLGVPLISPNLSEFMRKKRAAVVGSLFTVIVLIILFTKQQNF